MAQEIRVNMSALNGVDISPQIGIIASVLAGTSRAEIYPVVMKLLSAFSEEPERVLAFFFRDNPALCNQAQKLMALDILTGWPSSMKISAIEDDSLAKMMVLDLAGFDVADDPAEAFKQAVKDKKCGMAIWALQTYGQEVSASIAEDWHEYYLALSADGDGGLYLAAQVLNAAMVQYDPSIWEPGLVKVAVAKNAANSVGYFREQGLYFATRPTAAMEMLIQPHWEGYPNHSQVKEETT